MSISADAVYSQTLQSIIDAKLNELVKKSEVYESNKNQVLQAVEGESNKIQQIQLLLDGVRRCFQIQKDDDGVVNAANRHGKSVVALLTNIERFLEQPRYDSSVSDTLLDHWKSSLLCELHAQDSRYEYASLYARLVTDWLSSEGNAKTRLLTGDVEMEDSFEELESSAKLESRLRWQTVAFNPLDTNTAGIHRFLDKLFGKGRPDQKELFKALTTIKENVSAFEATLTSPGQFNESVIRWCIKGIIGSRRLGEKKLKVLQDFQNNTVILLELADVLNLRMANLDEWSWGDQFHAQQTRRLAGYYDVDMDEDLLQAVFLQYIGTKWAVFFRKSLADCVDTDGVWKFSQKAASAEDHQRRRYYTGSQLTKHSLNAERYRLWRSKYFLTQLPKVEWQVVFSEDGDEEADYSLLSGKAPRKQLASKAARKSAPSTGGVHGGRGLGLGGAKRHRKMMRYDEDDIDDDEDEDSVSSDADDVNDDYGDTNYETRKLMDLKQGLMRLFQTETLFSLQLHGKAAAFRGQFERWDDMLSHSTILVVLSFFGLSQRWLKFMNAFLKPKLQFMQDGETEPPHTRQRGVPKSHPLSDMMGEVILFCMDLLINQECDGAMLWRQYYDFWFWSNDVNLCAKAWASVKKFSKAFGFELDVEKAGSLSIDRTRPKQSAKNALGLPHNAIRWGFLYFDATSGEFEIDQTLVSNHIKELKHQLSEKDRKDIFSWIQAWNTYAITFFSTNFGKPAFCFGSNHIKKVLQALEKMQEEVFNDLNMITHITKTISNKYGIVDIPEGFVFFPTDLGGLDLRNPFIRPIQLSKPLLHNEPNQRLDEWEVSERETYEHAKKTFNKRVALGSLPERGFARTGHWLPPNDHEKHTFFSFEEYTKYREDYDYVLIPHDHRLGKIYLSLLKEPGEDYVELSHDIQNAIDQSSATTLTSSVRKNGRIHPYWLWVFQMYGPEIIRKFGGLNIVDAGVLPIGMLSLVKGNKVEWN